MSKTNYSIFVYYLMLLILPTFSHGENSRPVIGCGEQCIRLLSKFYGKQVSEHKIVELLRPNESGEASLYDLERCLKRIGLDCYAFKGSSKDLTQIQYPVVLQFKKRRDDKVGHFLIALRNAKEKKLNGYDPVVSGIPFALTSEMLDKFWTGIGLVVFPKQFHYEPWLLLGIISSSILFGSSIALIKTKLL